MFTEKRIIENASSTSARTPRIITNMPGRPSYDTNEDQLRSLIDLRFTVSQISELLHVSTRTIEQRLAEYGISARSFSTITDEELDSVVMESRTFHPSCGSKSLAGYLASRNVKVPKCIDIVGKLLRFVDESSEEGKMAVMLVVTRLLYSQTCYHLTSIEEFKFPNNFNNTSVQGKIKE